MRFMIMHKNDPQTEAGQPPPMKLVNEMGALIGEYAQSGRLIDGVGLGASKTRTRTPALAMAYVIVVGLVVLAGIGEIAGQVGNFGDRHRQNKLGEKALVFDQQGRGIANCYGRELGGSSSGGGCGG